MYKKNLQEILKEKPWLLVGLMNETICYNMELMLSEDNKELLSKLPKFDSEKFHRDFPKLFKKEVTEKPVKYVSQPDNYRNNS